MFNLVCVKWGSKYGPEYVNTLYSMAKRNVSLPHRFVCFTENTQGLDPKIETKPLPSLPITNPTNQGWWFKLALFQNPLYDLSGKTLYVDLDVVLVDNIDCFFNYTDDFCIIKDWNSRNQRIFYNSSVFCFEIGKHTNLWDDFIKNPELNMKTPGGDQMWITKQLTDAKFWPYEWCQSFKYQCQDGIPKDSKIIVFHGRPNPNEADNWNYRNKKYETSWIKEYWR